MSAISAGIPLRAGTITICQRTLFLRVALSPPEAITATGARLLRAANAYSLRNDAKVQRSATPECIKLYRSVLKCIVTYPNVSKCIKLYRTVSKRIKVYYNVS